MNEEIKVFELPNKGDISNAIQSNPFSGLTGTIKVWFMTEVPKYETSSLRNNTKISPNFPAQSLPLPSFFPRISADFPRKIPLTVWV